MPEEVLWPLEPSTEAKHRLYKRYLDAWWPIMLQQPWVDRVTYVDAFAGPGQYEGGQEGSPVFALDRLLNHVAVDRMNLSRERVRLAFIESERRRYEHLLALLTQRFGPLAQLPVRVEVKHGRAEEDTLPLLNQLDAWGHPVLAVFDSWGNVGVPWNQIRTIADNRSSEVMVTFGSNWFSRREEEEPAKLNHVFGGAEHWSPSDPTTSPADRWRFWLESYHAPLLRAGFDFALGFQVVPRTGQPLDLVFGTEPATPPVSRLSRARCGTSTRRTVCASATRERPSPSKKLCVRCSRRFSTTSMRRTQNCWGLWLTGWSRDQQR